TIRGTIAKPIVTDLSTTENVGDGVALLEASADVAISGVTLDNNARTQGLVSKGGANIQFQNLTVTATGSELKIVVQDTTQTINVDPMQISTSPKLGVASAMVAVPPQP